LANSSWVNALGLSFFGKLPANEEYGLKSQIRRAVVSVAANIADGFKKRGLRDKLRFYNIAQDSLEGCRYYWILIRELGYGDPKELMAKVVSVQNLLGTCMKRWIKKMMRGFLP